MTIPSVVSTSKLFHVLSTDDELVGSLRTLRSKSERLAETLIRDASMFTDHSVKHMDALWAVTETVLTEVEIKEMTPSEAFLLGAGFYLHDIGMSYAATEEGRTRLTSTSEYIGLLRGIEAPSASEISAALALAIRVHHANAALEFATKPIPGTCEYLIEPASVRDQFGTIAGRIAASHHWNVDRVEAELGTQEVVPMANGRKADIGYVAGVLRLVDYSHINRERAPTFARALRGTLNTESALHWDAQEAIDGPSRTFDDNELTYFSSSPQANVEAWWLFYEFARGLDDEIRQVGRFLRKRKVSANRMSLVGVKGANSPEEFAKYVSTDGFFPLNVGIKAASIPRLVNILAGESLYGKNFMAPVRELLQNSVDAVNLRRVTAVGNADKVLASLPIEVSLRKQDGLALLSVVDMGVGMSRKVLTEHLLTIASDYWESQFHIDFPNTKNFTPTGRFGIGFLSVFMLGKEVSVSSQRVGGDRFKLNLRGLGRRAELRTVSSEASSGTKVEVQLLEEAEKSLKNFFEILKCYVPMLPVELSVEADGQHHGIVAHYVQQLDVVSFKKWVVKTIRILNGGTDPERPWDMSYRYSRYLRSLTDHTEELELKNWPAGSPEFSTDSARLIADGLGMSILCSKGFTLQAINTPGYIGVINSSDVIPDAARKQSLGFDPESILKEATSYLKPKIVDNITRRRDAGFVSEGLNFILWACKSYGTEVLTESDFPWLQIVERSGNSRFLNTTELREMSRTAKNIYVGFAMGPNSVSGQWHALENQNLGDFGVSFSGSGYSMEYTREVETGSLNSLKSDRKDLVFFVLLLQILSETWNIQEKDLADQPNWTHKNSELFGFFQNP